MRRSFDPRTKLYLILLANLMLFFHVGRTAEILMTTLFLLPLFFAGRYRTGIHFLVLYAVMLSADFFLIPAAEGFFLNFLSLLTVGIRMMLPCIITGAYAFTTTTIGEFVCALRRMHVPESIVIPSMVVIRFFPTIREDYRQIRSSMALRGITEGGMGFLRHPAKTLEYVLIPLLMNSSTVAQDLSAAALTKGIGMAGEHTCMTELHPNAADVLYAALCTLPLLLFTGGVL